MSSSSDVHAVTAPPLAGSARGLIRWVCTSNPFYVVSAGLFLFGLWISFGAHAQTWELMSGLTGYTLLLAVTAFFLVRYCNLWDDVRTVLLLVVLMFLATSVTFDEVLVLAPRRGLACYLGGLLFAVLVSEGLLHGIRLRLPASFRLSYYLILTLFFVYPLGLSELLPLPEQEALLWGLFGFSPAAGLVFLSLIPAIRRGPEYVAVNGSPWRWPLYPWVLFGLLGFAVLGRSFLLCWSMHLLDMPRRDQLIFGPYFLVPFGWAVALLLLEIGLVTKKRGVLGAALALPLGLALLASVGHRDDPMYQSFLELFAARLGGTPFFCSLMGSLAFYVYAATRRVPAALDVMTAALTLLAVVGPETLALEQLAVYYSPVPLLAGALIQLALGVWRRSSSRCLLASVGLISAAAMLLPQDSIMGHRRDLLVMHLIVLMALILGAMFDDPLAQFLRFIGTAGILLFCMTVQVVRVDLPPALPAWVMDAYPPVMMFILAGYGLAFHQPALLYAAIILVAWLATGSWRIYLGLRQIIVGLDYLTLSLAVFVLAIGVSLSKARIWARGFARQEPEASRPSE